MQGRCSTIELQLSLLFIHSSVHGNLGGFHCLAIVTHVNMNTDIQISLSFTVPYHLTWNDVGPKWRRDRVGS
jgi:hypothetical protein